MKNPKAKPLPCPVCGRRPEFGGSAPYCWAECPSTGRITHEIVVNGRSNPPQVRFGHSSLQPDLAIRLSAESLHHILYRELRLRDALTRGKLKVRGPLWKSFVLEDIFHAAQDLYPQALAELDA